jgi:ribosomal protein S18 acetylase RimI-like enzyme
MVAERRQGKLCMSKILIREARAEELAAVESLVKAAYREFQELVPAAGWERWMASIAETVRSPDGALIVAESGGRLCGAVQFYPDATRSAQGQWPPGSGTIRILGVEPRCRGRGLGTRLTEECLRRARELKLPTIFLYTGEFMLSARHIYEKLGFNRAPEFDRDPGPIAYRLDL